ncbi:MAG: hypothetical protein D6706_09975 [Chloroflexi bacterium]|nr:MAG: hypothetical protein D6706_09975 [Chloroflexota bacterium]
MIVTQTSANILILGGTAAYEINPADFGELVESRTISTPYGRSPLFHLLHTSQGTAVWFSSRHGENQLSRSARFVNHRANIWAAHHLGIQLILSWNGVGAINPTLQVGDLVVPHALMDWTRNRIHTFGTDTPQATAMRQAARTIEHIRTGQNPRQTAHPFAPSARQILLTHAGLPPDHQATYVCTEGPRLETAAEIRLAAKLGADVVGMTLCPEVWLATELNIGYASLCLVTNFATGLWHIDTRREFGAPVAQRGMELLLKTAETWHHHVNRP